MKKRLWLTYAWKDNEEHDFDYLIQQINSEQIECKFDRITLVPGRRLWESISKELFNPELDAWAYLITKNSLASEPCKEELEYAITRTLESGGTFPIIGLVHNVSFKDIPPSLKTRLCIDLNNNNWKEQLLAGIENRSPRIEERSIHRLKTTIHLLPNETIIELTPRFETIINWRVAIPSVNPIKHWGIGISGSKTLTKTNTGIEGTIDLDGIKHNWVGSSDKINAGNSALIWHLGQPTNFYYGFGKSENDIPELWFPMRKN